MLTANKLILTATFGLTMLAPPGATAQAPLAVTPQTQQSGLPHLPSALPDLEIQHSEDAAVSAAGRPSAGRPLMYFPVLSRETPRYNTGFIRYEAASTETFSTAAAQSEAAAASSSALDESSKGMPQRYNFHTQYTLTGMGYPSFSAKYSNPAYLVVSGTGSSLPTEGQARETQSTDLYFGYRLRFNTEFHLDTLLWQGFGLNNTYGMNDFPNGEAFKVGVRYPHFSVVRFFLRKTINLGGGKEQDPVDDDLLTLGGQQDKNRITITAGRFSAKDMFDNNQYANDPRKQFMNWALMANAAWDYPADALGFTTGIAIEWTQSKWTLRYGWFQMSKYRNSFTAEGMYLTIPSEPNAGDGKIFQDWAMVTELEHRHSIGVHPGTVRLLTFDDRANMGSYKAAVALAHDPATLAVWGTPAKFLASANGVTGGIDSTHALRNTWGFGLNMDQEITTNIGAFSRIGWNVGQNESFEFDDANWTATFGARMKGEKWKQPDDVIGAAFITSGISKANQTYLADGGIGILTGDGALNYDPEKNVELYYDHKLAKYLRGTLDYQFVDDPAFNRDRGPVPGIFAIRLHYER
jgi:high affinity Mn2+ porin